MLNGIARIQFFRSIRSDVASGDIIKMELIVCSEFNDSVAGLLSTVAFDFHLVTVHSISGSENKRHDQLKDNRITINISKGTAQVTLKLPEVIGRYCLMISSRSTDDIEIMPLLSAPFQMHLSKNLSGKCAITLLHCYRLFHLPVLDSGTTAPSKELQLVENGGQLALIDDLHNVLIREEYGSTLGSHVYDSSAVLLRYLQKRWTEGQCVSVPHLLATCHMDAGIIRSETLKDTCTIVELGAGCGLVGLWLSRLSSRSRTCESIQVFLTDLGCQGPLILKNITANNAENCLFSELNWSKGEHLLTLQERLNGIGRKQDVDVVIAADVLYDKAAAQLMFATVKALATPGVTRLLLAQKMRRNSSPASDRHQSVPVDVRQQEGFENAEMVYQEADVIIWSLLAT